MTVTETVVRGILDIDVARLSDDAVDMAKRVILDGIAVTVAGAQEAGPKLVAELVRLMGGNEFCTVIGHGFRASPIEAAYVNGVSCHVLDFEPMWHPPTHPTSPTLPVALALAEWQGLDGPTLIVGLVAGFELQGRIRLATPQIVPDAARFHPPGIVGVMGAAMVGARMLGLSVEQSCMALGIAASRASSLMANVGSMTKSNHCGNAARLGLEAALLASRGYTANPDIFAARLGYAQVIFDGQFDFDSLTLPFGQPWRIADSGLVFKRYPCQTGTHYAVQAGLLLHHECQIAPAEVATITLTTPPMGYVDRPAPRTGLEGKFSFQYALAAAFLDGAVTIETFTDARLQQPDIQSLLPRIRVRQDPSIPADLPDMWVVATAECVDGRVIEVHADSPQGLWRRPLSGEEHRAKVWECMRGRVSDAVIEQCISAVDSLEALDGEDVRSMIRLLG